GVGGMQVMGGAPCCGAPIVQSWNGTVWSPITVPLGGYANVLTAVSCKAAGCVAAGRVTDAIGSDSTYVVSNLANMRTTAVAVTLTSSEVQQLARVARGFGQTPQSFLNVSVGALGYLIPAIGLDPTPLVLPPAGTDATYVVVFDAAT